MPVSLPSFLTPQLVACALVATWWLVLVALRRRHARGLALPRKVIRQKPMLTGNEREFYGRMRRALSGTSLEVAPQVAMGAILDVALPESHPEYWPIRRQFAQKIIDFVVYERADMSIVSVVELDDRTHDAAKDAARDAMLHAAGLAVTRWDSRAKPTEAAIRAHLERLRQAA